MLAARGASMTDHIREALLDGDREKLFHGTFVQNPARVLSLDHAVFFDEDSADQYRVIQLAREFDEAGAHHATSSPHLRNLSPSDQAQTVFGESLLIPELRSYLF